MRARSGGSAVGGLALVFGRIEATTADAVDAVKRVP
jgi:hypothetical protein